MCVVYYIWKHCLHICEKPMYVKLLECWYRISHVFFFFDNVHPEIHGSETSVTWTSNTGNIRIRGSRKFKDRKQPGHLGGRSKRRGVYVGLDDLEKGPKIWDNADRQSKERKQSKTKWLRRPQGLQVTTKKKRKKKKMSIKTPQNE